MRFEWFSRRLLFFHSMFVTVFCYFLSKISIVLVLFVGLESAAFILPSSSNARVWEGTSGASVLLNFSDFLAKAVSTSSFC